MARKKKVFGTCRLCGKDGELSFEHVPPQSAFNRATVIEYALESWVTKREVKGRQRQGGIGEHTLCEQCNNDTGSWYAAEYVRWAKTAFDILSFIRRGRNRFAGKDKVVVTLKNVYPLRFLKQVITCLVSVAGVSPGAEFAQNHPQLAEFILDRYQIDLPPNYSVYLGLYQSSILRRSPLSVKAPVVYGKDESGHILPDTIRVGEGSVFSEMAHPPFLAAMTYGTSFASGTDITYFKNHEYDQQVDVELPLTIGRGPTPYPGDYQALR